MDAEVVVYLLSQKLQNLLHDEAVAMTSKVKEQVQRTTHQLNLFRQLMKEGEKNQALAVEMNSSRWTTRLLRALYSMDDAIDTFLVRKALESQKQNGLMMMCQKPFTSLFNQVVFKKQMKTFISKTADFLKDKQHLDIQDVADSNIPGPSQYQRWGRISGFCFGDESHVVGLKEQIDEKIAKEPLLVDEVKWRLPKLLGQGRYLIVVDDVANPEFWEAIKDVFPPSSHGGVVIATTRKADVAVPAGSTLQVRPLNDEESWALFLKKLEQTEDGLHNS
ncbi:hypothetical protein CRYUN_Cryun31cG0067800 [Craigia yunnanensis]